MDFISHFATDEERRRLFFSLYLETYGQSARINFKNRLEESPLLSNPDAVVDSLALLNDVNLALGQCHIFSSP